MDTRMIVSTLVLVAIMGFVPVGSNAGEPGVLVDSQLNTPESGPGPASNLALATKADTSRVPWISGRLSEPVRSKLESSFEVAMQRLDQSAQCRALFIDLGVNGAEMLSTTLYYPASLKLEKQLCADALGWTTVGAAPTFLCRRFSKLSNRRAASVLLHEALHHAGLDEWPHDPGGLPPSAIDDLVEQACGL
jgi:hypothetical protein